VAREKVEHVACLPTFWRFDPESTRATLRKPRFQGGLCLAYGEPPWAAPPR
jgi:hypothetical protein